MAWLALADGTIAAQLAAYRTAASQDAHSIVTNPLLVNPPTDSTLQAGSPAINAGVAISGVNDGYLGTAPDLGFAEKA